MPLCWRRRDACSLLLSEFLRSERSGAETQPTTCSKGPWSDTQVGELLRVSTVINPQLAFTVHWYTFWKWVVVPCALISGAVGLLVPQIPWFYFIFFLCALRISLSMRSLQHHSQPRQSRATTDITRTSFRPTLVQHYGNLLRVQ